MPAVSALPLVVVAHEDPATAEALRHAVDAAAGWRVTVAGTGPVAVAAALASRPGVALVGCGVLADLPAGHPVPIVAVGDDARSADLRAALAAGARGFLTWPDDAAELTDTLARVVARPAAADLRLPSGSVVAVRGVQGGAGATTIGLHLAAGWATFGPASSMLLDLAGGLGYRLDLPAEARGWAALASMASGLDGELLDDAVPEPLAGLGVVALRWWPDGGLEAPPDPWLVEVVVEAARAAGRIVVLDLPSWSAPGAEAALALADVLLVVARAESAGVRAAEAALELWCVGGHDESAAGAVVTAAGPAAALAPREIRSALGSRLWALVPWNGPELAAAAEDGVVLVDRPEVPAVQAMLTLAHRVLPFPATAVAR